MFLVILIQVCLAGNEDHSVALQQSQGFFGGLVEGLQVNPASPTNCVKSFNYVSTSYGYFTGILTSLEVTKIYPLFRAFNDFVNQFVSSFDICKYASFLNKYFSDSETAILNLLINITGNWDSLTQSLSNLFLYIAEGADSFAIGVSSGEVLRYLTGFSL
jgi:hypothetical protein